MRRFTWLVAMLVLLQLSPARAAPLHYVYQHAPTAKWDNGCTDAYAEVSDGTKGEGFAKGWSQSIQYDHDLGDCDSTNKIDKSPNNIKVRMLIYHQVGSTWSQCNSPTGWMYNTVTTYHADISRNYNAPCGTGWYAIYTDAWVKDGGTWHGGLLWSGAHWWCKGGC